ncbi:helix-turn-helix domain-containing protein [Rheinheimera sp. EpRS3]|uniref:helix-turn-helix domain-containing protein n=1 Tax=Rheinheimera sp. EpRS3 TaxID=1712383 RepID=UPI000748A1B9|nr:hypothetical protein AR688_12690 [Rheinheimera sp. EpRS3]
MLLGAKSKYAANNTLRFYVFFTLLRITQIYQVNFAATALCICANAPRIAQMKIGNILRHRRKLLGKTLEDVAYAAETDAGNLSRIERDEQRPSLDLLEAIAHALDTQVSALYQSAEAQNHTQVMEQSNNYNPSATAVDAQLALLLKHYHSLTDEGRALAVNLISTLKKPHSAGK